MTRYLVILAKLFRFSLVNFLEYRADFWLTWSGDILAAAFTVVLFATIYSQVQLIAGWSRGEIYLLLAVVSYIEALIYFLYLEGIRSISRQLPQGELDFSLTKPVDFQFLMTFSKISPHTLGPLMPAVILTIAGLRLLAPSFFFVKLLLYFYLIVLGLLIPYSLALLLTSYSFIATRFHGVMHLDSRLRDLGGNPLEIFPQKLKLLFLSIVPVAFFGPFPVAVFRQSFSPWLILYGTVFALLWLVVSRRIFYFCLRHYSSASS